MQTTNDEILLLYDMTCKMLDFNSKFYMPDKLEHYEKLKEKLEIEINKNFTH